MTSVKLNHIAIIPDGNRRWARLQGLPTIEGHRRGFDSAVRIARKVRDMEISTLTLWAFSTENWNRAQSEIGYLMKLFEILIDKNLTEAKQDKTRILHIGRKDRLGSSLLKKIEQAEFETKQFDSYYLNIALDYGGKDEILRAINKINSKGNSKEQISEKQFESLLDTADLPYPFPDLVVRTSGELRTSGFMLWQAAYAEYVFLEKNFPDVTEEDIEKVVREFENRIRRFGK